MLSALLLIAMASVMIGSLFAVSPIAVALPLLAVSALVGKEAGVLQMAIQVEVWQNDIIKNLFKDAAFIQEAYNEDQYVLNGKVVHIPVAAAPDKSKKNLTSFPRSATKRVDDDIVYALDVMYREPKHVENIDQYELSYDKRQSIMGEEQSQLIQDSHDSLLYRWALTGKNMDTPGSYVLTTGGATSADVLASATGSRKIFTKDVFGVVKKRMDVANIPANGRVALLTAYHHQQFLDSLSDAERTNVYRYADMQKGVIGMYLGFTIYMRSSVQRWRKISNVWTPIDELADGFTAGTGDSAASLIYQKDCVSRALGAVKVFDNKDQALYFGDIISMNMRFGGRQRRALGVYSIIEDIV